ncbi:response regulator transcription factor [Rhodocytophaga aerolata]|uniref:Response regulator transcription factor n=1 Tax=Rhodocytophaga aerolata TaxID=455078 RepID=A0ABT8R9P8_9BACT|nr:response regulator transcription factor [Rhodocytophaga aerolata]MDO1448421.1 response regulator transcription factor [Rhodocytophaga aerolata]
MKRDDYQELIRKYYRKELSEAELVRFNQLQNTAAFAKKLTEFKLFRDLFDMQSLYEQTQLLMSGIAFRSGKDTYSTIVHVAIVDNHVSFSKQMAETIAAFSGYQVLWEAISGPACIKNLSAHPLPDILLITNTRQPEMDSYQLVAWVKSNYPQIQMLITTQAEDELLEQMLEAGAGNYVRKDAEPVELKKMLDSAVRRKLYKADPLAAPILKSAMLKQPPVESNKLALLSKREIEIIKLTCNEYSSSVIAERLNLSSHTVNTHRKNILQKLGVKTQLGLVRFALQNGLIDSP